MTDTSERIVILSAILLAVIFIRSTQMYSKEPIYEIEFEIPENYSIGFWVDDDLNDPDKARNESAWIKALRLTVEPSPNLDIVKLSSEDEDVPRSIYTAIDKVLPDDESVAEGVPQDFAGVVHLYGISVAEAYSIIHYFGEEIVEGRDTYEFYVSFVDYNFSIFIQFSRPFPTS